MGEAVVAALIGAMSALVVNALIQRATDSRFEAELKSKYELASLDKRLEAHQEAYTLWYKLLGKQDRQEVDDFSLECHRWWVRNNLYLREDARDAFYKAITSAPLWAALVNIPSDDIESRRSNTENVKTLHADKMAAGKIITESIGYIHRDPSLHTDSEAED